LYLRFAALVKCLANVSFRFRASFGFVSLFRSSLDLFHLLVFSEINELESKADLALVSLSKSQEVPLRRSQRRIEAAAAIQASTGIPLDGSLGGGFDLGQSNGQSGNQGQLGLGRSQFVEFDDLALELGASANLNNSWGGGALRSSSRLRNSQSLMKGNDIGALSSVPSLTQSQELRRGLRVSNSLNKADFPGKATVAAQQVPAVNNVLMIDLPCCFFLIFSC